MKDFFVSYNRADRQWAEWIAWTLEEAGYTVVIQAWDFRPGGNFVLDMQQAAAESQKTIAVLSETYLKSSFTQPEWAAAFADDPQALRRNLLPIRVKECKPEGILRSVVYVDLVGLSQADAEQALLNSLVRRAKPEGKPTFPGIESSEENLDKERVLTVRADFPSALSRVQKFKEKTLQQSLDDLMSDYEDLSQQRDNTISLLERNRLGRQLESLAENLDEIAAELDFLGK